MAVAAIGELGKTQVPDAQLSDVQEPRRGLAICPVKKGLASSPRNVKHKIKRLKRSLSVANGTEHGHRRIKVAYIINEL